MEGNAAAWHFGVPETRFTVGSDMASFPSPDVATRNPLVDELLEQSFGDWKLKRCSVLVPRAHLSNHTQNALGEHGRERLQTLRSIAESEGRSLGLSLAEVDGFFHLFSSIAEFDASIFLGNQGIELQWEDSAGKTVEIEFTGNGMEYYIESLDEEGLTRFDDLGSLVRKLETL
jgi:hypothetical protein